VSVNDVSVARLATRQCGVVARRQLAALGMSESAIDRRIRAGRYIPLYKGVYAVGHRATSDLGRIVAALLAVPKAVASHTTAAYLHNLILTLPPFVEVTVHGRGGRSREGLVIHETTRPPNVAKRRGIRVTDIGRTLEDCDDERVTREAVVRGLVPPRRDVAPTRSNVERRMLKLIEEAGLPRPLVNHKLGPYVLDFAWLDQRVVLEVDTYATHGDQTTFEKDRARDADLNAWGFRVMRATDRQIGVRTIARLAATLSR
jgi:hypothetical protein